MPDMVWERHNVFISYKRDDRELAQRVRRGLEAVGFRCWIDDRVNLGAEFWEVICQAIGQAQAVVVVATPQTARSEWVLDEVTQARDTHRQVVPVLTGDVPPSWLKPVVEDLSWFGPLDATGNTIGDLAEKLIKAGIGSLTDRVDQTLFLDRLGPSALDATDRGRLAWLATETMRHFSGTPCKEAPTVHGLRHSNGILTVLDGLLSPTLREDRETAFALAAAACLHDWGRYTRTTEEASPVADADSARERREHHCRSRAAVYELAGEAEFTPAEAMLIADLCYYHNVRTNLHELADRPEAAEAAALFRLANACDLGLLRAPASYWQLYGRHNAWSEEVNSRCFPLVLPRDRGEPADGATAIADAAFWMRSQLIAGVRASRRERRVTVFAAQSGPTLDLVSRQAKGYLERMLLQLQPFIGRWQVEPRVAKFAPSRPSFTLQDCLLLGASAYTDPEAVVSSSSAVADYCLSAALALAKELEVEGPARLIDEAGAHVVLRRLVNGLVLQRRELQLLHWLHRQVTELGHEPFAKLGERFRRVRRGRQPAPLAVGEDDQSWGSYPLSAMARHAYTELPEEGDVTFVVFGHSGPVRMLIQHCLLAGRNVRAYVPLMRPVGDGPALQAVEALRDLKQADLDQLAVQVVPDVALAHVLTRHKAGTVRALMGCEVWIGREEELVANSLGCLTFGHIVRGCGVPLWVLAEKAKRLTKDDTLSPYWPPPQARQSTDDDRDTGPMPVSAYIHEAEASRYVADSNATYPRSETMPEQLIDAIVSEDGFHGRHCSRAADRRLFIL